MDSLQRIARCQLAKKQAIGIGESTTSRIRFALPKEPTLSKTCTTHGQQLIDVAWTQKELDTRILIVKNDVRRPTKSTTEISVLETLLFPLEIINYTILY